MFLNWSAKDRFRSALTFIISGFLALSPLKQLTIAKQIMKGLAKIPASVKNPDNVCEKNFTNITTGCSLQPVQIKTLFSAGCCYLDQKFLLTKNIDQK